MIDSHCHLDAAEFDIDRDEVVARATALNINTIIVPAVTRSTFVKTLDMRTRYGCPVALGLHPVYINEHSGDDLQHLQLLCNTQSPIAIGEIGLDFFIPELDQNQQVTLFAEQLKIARDFNLPVLLHVRKSQDQVLAQLRRFGIKRGIAHAFNGSRQQAEAYIRQGLLLGFGGNLSFEKAQNIRRLATELPLECIALETDAPDMSPEWVKGLRNEPANLAKIAAILAELRNTSIEQITNTTTANVRKALNLPGVWP